MTTLINRFAGYPVTTATRLLLGGAVNIAGALALVALVADRALVATGFAGLA